MHRKTHRFVEGIFRVDHDELERKLGDRAYNLWCCLISRRNVETGYCRCKLAQMARFLEAMPAPVGTVRRALNKLIAAGLVSKVIMTTHNDPYHKIWGRPSFVRSGLACVQKPTIAWLASAHTWGGKRTASTENDGVDLTASKCAPSQAIGGFSAVKCQVRTHFAPAKLPRSNEKTSVTCSNVIPITKSKCAPSFAAAEATPRYIRAHASASDSSLICLSDSSVSRRDTKEMLGADRPGKASFVAPAALKTGTDDLQSVQSVQPTQVQAPTCNSTVQAHAQHVQAPTCKPEALAQPVQGGSLGYVLMSSSPRRGPRPLVHRAGVGLSYKGVPPHVFVHTLIAQVPKPPMLSRVTHDLVAQCTLLARWYTHTAERLTKKRCWVFRVKGVWNDITKSRWFPLLKKAVAAFEEHEIAPATWCMWSHGQWADNHQGASAPVSYVFGAKRIEERRGWFRSDVSAFGEGGQSYTPSARRLLSTQTAMRTCIFQECPDDDRIAVIVEHYFPGDTYEKLVAATKKEAAAQVSKLAEQLTEGEWIWL